MFSEATSHHPLLPRVCPVPEELGFPTSLLQRVKHRPPFLKGSIGRANWGNKLKKTAWAERLQQWKELQQQPLTKHVNMKHLGGLEPNPRSIWGTYTAQKTFRVVTNQKSFRGDQTIFRGLHLSKHQASTKATPSPTPVLQHVFARWHVLHVQH